MWRKFRQLKVEMRRFLCIADRWMKRSRFSYRLVFHFVRLWCTSVVLAGNGENSLFVFAFLLLPLPKVWSRTWIVCFLSDYCSLSLFESALEIAQKYNSSHVDTVLVHRQKYLNSIGRSETNPRFQRLTPEKQIEWSVIEEKMQLEIEKEAQRPNARPYEWFFRTFRSIMSCNHHGVDFQGRVFLESVFEYLVISLSLSPWACTIHPLHPAPLFALYIFMSFSCTIECNDCNCARFYCKSWLICLSFSLEYIVKKWFSTTRV